jgi:hypothetical protein
MVGSFGQNLDDSELGTISLADPERVMDLGHVGTFVGVVSTGSN